MKFYYWFYINLPLYFKIENFIDHIKNSPYSQMFLIESGYIFFEIYCFEKSHLLKAQILQNKIVIFSNLYEKNNKKIINKKIKKLLGIDEPNVLLDIYKHSKLNNILKLTKNFNLWGYTSYYQAFINIIMGQLISSTVANLFRKKFILYFGKQKIINNSNIITFPLPKNICELSIEKLRHIGISASKCKSIKEISSEFKNNDLEKIIENKNMRELETYLLNIYGIGKWSVDWFMLHVMRDFDRIPVSDLAIRKSLTWYFKKEKTLHPSEIENITNKWSPYKGLISFKIMRYYLNLNINTVKT